MLGIVTIQGYVDRVYRVKTVTIDLERSPTCDMNSAVAPRALRNSSAKRGKLRRRSSETRENVLSVAHELFYWSGIRATGIDRVAAEAEVAPTALYRVFSSKDALVAAYVARMDQNYRAWFTEATRADGRTAAERIVSLFDALTERVQPEICRGCPFLMALTEFPDADLEAHRIAARLKRWVRARFRNLAAELASERTHGRVTPRLLADHLMLLFEGVYATVQALGPMGPARRARYVVAALVKD